MALAGDRATASVATRDPTATTCAGPSSARNASRRPTARKAVNTKTHVTTTSEATIASVGRGFLRSSASLSSEPAATPMTARHVSSTQASREVRDAPTSPETCGPARTPTRRCALI